jgi:putative transposase
MTRTCSKLGIRLLYAPPFAAAAKGKVEKFNRLVDTFLKEAAFKSDSHPLRFIEPDVLANAFLHCEIRKVDKSGCINFMSKKYEVGLNFIGCKVNVVYDPADISELTIEYEGYTPWQAKELLIGERVGKRPGLPEHLEIQPVDSSRLLTAAASRKKERQSRQNPAISFRGVGKEDGSHV